MWLMVLALAVGGPVDPLAGEIARWSAFVREQPAGDELLDQVLQQVGPGLARAEQARQDGHRLLALDRFAAAHEDAVAARFLADGKTRDAAALEASWKQMGTELPLGPPAADASAGIRPALLRGLAEAALAQVPVYYHASLEYGRSTTPDAGLYYLGAAEAGRQFGALAARLSDPGAPPATPLRSVAPEIDALQADLLALYRPPASIDRHRDFIAASSMLKQARELDAAGLRYGAVLRWLQAARRVGLLKAAPAPANVVDRLRDAANDLGDADHTIARLFVEAALDAETPAAEAAVVLDEVLPRYRAALGPPPPATSRPAPGVAVTLVRWPYT